MSVTVRRRRWAYGNEVVDGLMGRKYFMGVREGSNRWAEKY